MMASFQLVSPSKEEIVNGRDWNTYIGLCRNLGTAWPEALEHGTADGYWEFPRIHVGLVL
jgi:hypothetical protein